MELMNIGGLGFGCLKPVFKGSGELVELVDTSWPTLLRPERRGIDELMEMMIPDEMPCLVPKTGNLLIYRIIQAQRIRASTLMQEPVQSAFGLA
jgi:hypothetical protein